MAVTTNQLVITCVGDLVEDIVVSAPAGIRTGTDSPARIERHRGGSAANVAVAVAIAGGASRYVGNVGTDLLGDQLLGQLTSHGVDLAVTRSGRTGSIVALVDASGERSFLTDRGSADDLISAPDGWLLDTTVVHVPMYSLLTDPLRATTLVMLSAASNAGCTISLDASSTGALTDAGVSSARSVIEQLGPDYLFCNRDEAELLGISEHTRLATTTVIKQGAEPTVILCDTGVVSYPVPLVRRVIDTNGAGDAFAAAFLVAAVQQRLPLPAAVAAAHELAGRAVVVHGATPAR